MYQYRNHLLSSTLFNEEQEINNYISNMYVRANTLSELSRAFETIRGTARYNDMYVNAYPLIDQDDLLLSVCAYKEQYFIGFLSRKDMVIRFTDEFGLFDKKDYALLDLLVSRCINMILKPNLVYNKNLYASWRDVLPLLHAVMLYDKYMKTFDAQYYNDIDILVKTFEANRDLDLSGLYLAVNGKIPSFELAWELYNKMENESQGKVDYERE